MYEIVIVLRNFFKDLSVTLENGVSEVPSNLVTNIAACEVVIESCVSSNY